MYFARAENVSDPDISCSSCCFDSGKNSICVDSTDDTADTAGKGGMLVVSMAALAAATSSTPAPGLFS